MLLKYKQNFFGFYPQKNEEGEFLQDGHPKFSRQAGYLAT